MRKPEVECICQLSCFGFIPAHCDEHGGDYGGFGQERAGAELPAVLLRGYGAAGAGVDEMGKCETDPVPNRHAVIHGLISYSTAQNSINTLIMVDFMFHLIGVVGMRLATQKAGTSPT